MKKGSTFFFYSGGVLVFLLYEGTYEGECHGVSRVNIERFYWRFNITIDIVYYKIVSEGTIKFLDDW